MAFSRAETVQLPAAATRVGERWDQAMDFAYSAASVTATTVEGSARSLGYHGGGAYSTVAGHLAGQPRLARAEAPAPGRRAPGR